ncbi:MAG: hypothetical protein ACUVUD_01375 [bacterium]
MCEEREKTGLTSRQRFSVLGRIATFALALPGILTINRPLEIFLSLLFLVYLYLICKPPRQNRLPLRTFIWLAPTSVLTNALLGPEPKIFNLFSVTGVSTGILLLYRLLWGVLLTTILIPQDQLLDTLKPLFGANFSSFLSVTLQLVPTFADIRITELRQLPDTIARRIVLAQSKTIISPPPSVSPPNRIKLLPLDALTILPAAFGCALSFFF